VPVHLLYEWEAPDFDIAHRIMRPAPATEPRRPTAALGGFRQSGAAALPPKTAPGEVAKLLLDGPAADQEDIFPDPNSRLAT
jgi:hypothetical protein